jgi:hypothetical protein
MESAITSPTPIVLQDARPFYSMELLAARAEAAQRRSAAMCMEHDIIAGMYLRPLTPATYSMLTAIGSPFPVKGQAGSGAVRTYVWLHSDLFTTDPRKADRARAKVFAELDRRIAPPWRRWRYSRAGWQTLIAAGYAVAAAKIAEIFEVAFADAPPPGRKGPTVGASLEAQFIDTFAGAYAQWPFPTSISNTPLRKLYQLLRCMNGGDFNPDEAEIIAAELKADNEALAATRANT